MPARLARAFRILLGPRLPVPGDVHICSACLGDCVNPVAWDEAGEERWLVTLRCGACGHEHVRALSHNDSERLLNALDRGYLAIETAADRLQRELMTAWVESFNAALRRDLIDAGDFRPVDSRSSLP